MKETILIVDDSRTVRKVISTYLDSEDYNSLKATQGQEGLVLTRKHRPDLILLDLVMPVMSGYEFLDALQNEPPELIPPVIIISANSTQHNINKAMAYKAAKEYLIKPFSKAILLQCIRKQLNPNNAKAATGSQ